MSILKIWHASPVRGGTPLTPPDATITTSFPNNLEIGGSTTSKAEALRQLGKKLGIRREEMLAAGDSPNDIAMLQEAGIAVAMGIMEKKKSNLSQIISPAIMTMMVWEKR